MKIKTFILTFLMMSCSIVFGQGTYSGSATTEAQLWMHLNDDEIGTISLANDIKITATCQIPNGKKVTIDLNGHKLFTEEEIYIINNEGKLTITDSSEGKTGTISSTLGIYNGVTPTRTSVTDVKFDRVLTINGGVFNSSSTNGNAATIYNYRGVIKINGGEFYGEHSAITNYGMATIANAYIECLNRDNGAAAIINDFEIAYGENVNIVGRYTTVTQTAYTTGTEPTYLFAELNGVKYPSLQAALDACTTGDNTIKLLFHNSKDATVSQKEGVNITIDGNGYKGKQFEYSGTITVDGKSAAYATAGLTIEDVKFNANNIIKDASINLGGNNSIRYTSNVTVKNCTFEGVDKAKVAIKNYTGGCKNLVVKNCEATGLHSLVQVKGIKGVTVEDVKVTDCKNGISVGTSDDVAIKGADIEAEGYGLRADGSGKYSLNVENSTLSAEVPVIIRETTGEEYKLTVAEDVTLTATNGGPQVVVTADSDDVPYVAPTVKVNVTLNNDASTFGLTAKIGNKYYSTFQNAINAAVDGDVITLVADITEDVKITQKADLDLIINGDGKKFTGVMTVFGDARHDGNETLTIENINFVAKNGSDACILSPDRTAQNPARYSYSHNVTVYNCTFTDPDGNVNCAAIRHNDGGDVDWTLNKCTVDNTMHSLIQTNNVKDQLVIAECTVNSKNGVNLNSCTNVEMTECNFNVKGYAVRVGVNGGTSGAITLNNNTLKSACEDGDAVIIVRGSAVTQVDLSMKENVVSGTTHISGNTAATKIAADENYWDGKEAPVVAEGSAPIVVNSYYSDEALTNLVRIPMGDDFTAYTREDAIWGEVWGNAFESFVIKAIDANGNVMGTASLKEESGYIDGDVEVTWSLYFDVEEYTGSSWEMNWTTRPTVANMPVRVELHVDGVKVGEGPVQLNDPDDLNKMTVAKITNDENGYIEKFYTSFDAAYKAATTGDVFELLETAVITNTKNWINYSTKQITVKANFGETAFRVQSGNSTVWFGKMTIESNDYCIIVGASDGSIGAYVDIYGGTYKGATTAISVTKGDVNILGGTFQVEPYEGSYEYTINCIDANYINGTAEVSINGGKFYNFNPQNNAAEGPGTNFLTAKYAAYEDADNYWNVVEAEAMIVDNGKTQYYVTLQDAVSAATDGQTVTLCKNINESVNISKLEKNITIDGNDYGTTRQMKGLSLGSDNNKLDAGVVTVKNIKFVGSGLSVNELANVTIQDNTFTNITEGNAITVICDELTENVNVNGNIISNVEVGTGIRIRNAKSATVTGNKVSETFNNAILLEGVTLGDIAVRNNVLSNWGKDVEEKGRAIRIVKGENTNATITGNAMLHDNAPEQFVKISGNTENVNVDENYWNGKNPFAEELFTDDGNNNAYPNSYYAKYDAETNELSELVTIAYVAKIGKVQYLTFEAALNAVNDGETIELFNITGSENKEIEYTKDIEFTITGEAPNYALPVVTFQNAIVNIKDAEILIPELDARQNATINVINSTIVDAGGNSIVKSYYNGAINIDANSTVYAMQVTTMGYITVAGTLNATWQTNVYGNGLITLNQGATFNTAALHLTAQDYSGRDNTDADRVGKPAEIVVDGANFTVGKVYSDNGADYSYNSSKGINVGTVDGKSAILNIKNGGNVNIHMANGETANIGAGGTVNIAASTFNVECRAENGTATLANNGTVNVSGESTLNIQTLTGESIDFLDGAIINNSTIGGNVFVAGAVTFRGDNTFAMLYDYGTLKDYYGTTAPMKWNVKEGASVTLTNEARYGLGYGDEVTVIGNIENALTARENLSDDDRSLFMHGLVAQEASGWNCNSKLTVVNAYVVLGSNNSFGNKPGNYGGTYKFDFNNSVVDGSRITFYEANSQTEFTLTNSDVRIGTFMTRDADSKFILTGSKVLSTADINGNDEGNYNAGELVLNNSSLTYTAAFTNTGVLNIGEKSNVTAPTVINNGIINFTSLTSILETTTEGLVITLDSNYPDYKVVYKDGKYQVVEKDYVAQIGEQGYETLAEAATAAQDGETIELLWTEGNPPIAMNASLYGKNVTITGTAKVDWRKGWLFVGRGGEGNATLTFDDANLTSASADENSGLGIHVSGREKGTNNKYDGTLVIKNSTIELDYLIDRGTITLGEGANLTVKNGFGIAGRPASETENDSPATATISLENGAKLIVNNHNGMGVGQASTEPEGYGIMNIDATSTFETTQKFNISANGTMNVNGGNVKVAGTLTNAGTVYVTGEANLDATVTGDGWFYMNGVTLDDDTKLLGAKVRFASGTNNIDGSTIDDGFFQVGIGAYNGTDANVDTEDGVVVNVKNAVIGANGDTYAGWAGTGFYDTDTEKAAAMTDAKYVLNIENSIAEFGYLHISNDGELNVNGNATEKAWYNNSDYSFYAGEVIINGTATFDATDVLALYTKVSCDNGTTDNPGTLNIVNGTEYEAERHNAAVAGLNFDIRKTGIVNVAEGADLHVGEHASIAADATMNIGGTATVLGELTNNGTINLTDLNAKFTAKEGLTIVDKVNNKDYKIVYQYGTYQFVAKQFVAQIYDVDNNTNDDRRYESLQEAIDAVAEGETVKLMADVTITEPAYGQNALNHACAINFTLDLNGKTLSANTGNSVFRFNISGSGATGDVTVTIKNGTVVSGANTWCALMASGISSDVKAIMNLEDLTIENCKGGDFAVKAWANGVVNAERVIINSTYGGGFYAPGGKITLDNCTVNQKGLWKAPYNSMAVAVSNGGKMTVNSGTYSAAPIAATDGNNQGTSHGSWTGGVMSSGGTLIINGGTFSNGNIGGTATNPRELFIVGADADYGDNVNGQVIINGGTFTSIGNFIHCETIWGSANDSANDYMPTMGVTITAGDFTAVAGKTIGGCDPVSTGNPVDVKISGGTYGANHAIDDSYLVVGYIVFDNGNGTYSVVEDQVAKIGDVTYKLLQEAFDAAQDGDEIVVLKDIVLTEGITVAADDNMTLDLNGNTISMQDASGAGAYAIKNNGNLTIKDSAEGGKITFNSTTPDNSFGYATSTIGNGGHLTIENGLIENTTVGGASYAVDGIWHTGEASLTINDGTITATKIAVRQVPFSATAKNTVTINGGTFTGATAGLQMFNINSEAKLSETIIMGGTFNGTYGFYTSFTSAQASELATINIDGGTFNGYVCLYNGKNGSNAYPMTVAITDGLFNSGAYIYTKDANGNEVPIKAITGGTFSVDPSVYCAEEFTAIYDEVTELYNVMRTSAKLERTLANAGWYWFSSYVNIDGNTGLDKLKNALGESGEQIKNATQFINYHPSSGWKGTLTSAKTKEMYQIKTTADNVTIYLEGSYSENLTIELKKGWNYLAYPMYDECSLNDALRGFTPQEGDIIKSKNSGNATYTNINGTLKWKGNLATLKPGEGYMYYSNSETVVSLTFSTSKSRTTIDEPKSVDYYWSCNDYEFASNMTVIAMLNIDDELVNDNYEIAAFANGECRGSARPVYVEEIDQYILFMTIHGEDVQELTFKYYDVNYGTVYELNNRINYSSDAVVGSIAEPYMLTRGTTGIGEAEMSQVNIYPNPTTTGTEINLQATCDKVEVFNALGAKVAEYQNVDSIDALETAGIYVIRITNNGNVQNCKLVVR